jgi:hypothetical protein
MLWVREYLIRRLQGSPIEFSKRRWSIVAIYCLLWCTFCITTNLDRLCFDTWRFHWRLKYAHVEIKIDKRKPPLFSPSLQHCPALEQFSMIPVCSWQENKMRCDNPMAVLWSVRFRSLCPHTCSQSPKNIPSNPTSKDTQLHPEKFPTVHFWFDNPLKWHLFPFHSQRAAMTWAFQKRRPLD